MYGPPPAPPMAQERSLHTFSEMHTTPKQILYSCQNSNITTLSYINPVLSRITGSQSCSPAQRSRPAPSRPTPARRAGTGWPTPTRSPTRGPGRRTPPPNSRVETERAAAATSHSAPADILIASQPSMSVSPTFNVWFHLSPRRLSGFITVQRPGPLGPGRTNPCPWRTQEANNM